MASQARSTKLPADLAEAAELRARTLGYVSWNAYIKGLIRYDLLVQGPHTVTLPISQLRPEEQDKVDSELLDRAKSGIGARGQLLENIVQRIAGADRAEAVKRELPHAIKKGRPAK